MNPENRLSVIIITLNEESNIKDCLESVRFADEIVVVDGGSTDRTVEIARSYTDKVFTPGWLGFSEAKQYALERATGDWILWVDADERITKELRDEILKKIAEDSKYAAFAIPRKSYFLGRWIKHSGWYPGYVVRLFKKEKASFDDLLVHEGVRVLGKIGRLRSPIEHNTYPTITKYFQKFNIYTSLAAKELRKRGVRVGLFDIFFRPIATFFKMYFQKLGFLDGLEGFILALFSAFYVLVKYAKLKYYE